MVYTRRRGTALIDTPKGILVVSKDGKTFITPGGGAKPRESRQDAAIRELKEETGMKVVEIAYLFDFSGAIHTGGRGGVFKNAHKVFLVKAKGVPEPREEITSIAYYDGSSPEISYSAQKIIEKYHATDRSRAEFVSAKCPNDDVPLDVWHSPPKLKCAYCGAILLRVKGGTYRQK